MIGIRLRIPIACWRKAHARELIETEILPPPATCYGALLSLVGETERERHIGCRVTSGLLNEPRVSTILRTSWRVKDKKIPQGTGENARPDFQQLVIDADLVIWCDSSDEEASGDRLETRVEGALRRPASVERFGGWSLGESTHLVNDASLLGGDGDPPGDCRTFVVDDGGTLTLPVWVDHVGTIRTRYAVGTLRALSHAPERRLVPRIVRSPSAMPKG
jgi:CRISPR-associated protein Cas5t